MSRNNGEGVLLRRSSTACVSSTTCRSPRARLRFMLLTLDVGNSQIFCGVYAGDDLKVTFRRTSSIRASSDEFGTFFRATLRENGIDPEEIDMAGICSVAPDAVHSLRNCF